MTELVGKGTAVVDGQGTRIRATIIAVNPGDDRIRGQAVARQCHHAG